MAEQQPSTTIVDFIADQDSPYPAVSWSTEGQVTPPPAMPYHLPRSLPLCVPCVSSIYHHQPPPPSGASLCHAAEKPAQPEHGDL
jgi:hypothetical protein